MVSILTVTYNRKALAEQCLCHALSHTGTEYEFLSVDNGSTDGVADYVASLKPVFHQRNDENEGYAAMLNQMILRANGKYICVLDPDLVMPNDWLWKLVDANEAIPESGLCGVHCVQGLPETRIINEKTVHPAREVFGVKMLSRRVMNTIGYFYEGYGKYGHEDVDMNYRMGKAGFINYYVSGMAAQHAGEDSGSTDAYRMMKWEALKQADLIWTKRYEYMEATQDFYVPAPAMRWIEEKENAA